MDYNRFENNQQGEGSYRQQEGSSNSQAANYRQQEENSSSQAANYRQQEENSSSQAANYRQQEGSSSSQAANYRQQEGSGFSQAPNYGTQNSQGDTGYGNRNQNAYGSQNAGGFRAQGENSYSNPYGQQGYNNGNPYQQPNQFRNQPHNNRPKKTKSQSGMGSFIGKCAVGAATFGVVASLVFTGVSYVGMNALGVSSKTEESTERTKIATNVTQTSTGLAGDITDVSGIASEVMPSIVAITNVGTTTYQSIFGSQTYPTESAGSGIIVKKDDKLLYIVTNNHVVSQSESLTVQFSDNTTASAEVTGTDPSDDLAVIQVKLDSIEKDTLNTIKVATIGDSSAMTVGQATIAIGNALGYGQSVTTGVVSALGRTVSTQDETTGQTITNTNLIQTDAAINPGNSGGALLNAKGEVIGINSVKYADTEVEGIGYAIPMEDAATIIEALINGDKLPQNAYLGIMGEDVSSSIASTYNMPEGVYIREVIKGSAAETAGLKAGDIITSIEKQEISSMSSLKALLAGYKEGKKVTLKVSRMSDNGYVSSDVEVTLGGTTSDTTKSGSSNNGNGSDSNGKNGNGSQGNGNGNSNGNGNGYGNGNDGMEEFFNNFFN